jgi:hypothetical protein
MTIALEQRFYSPGADPSASTWMPVSDNQRQSENAWRFPPMQGGMAVDVRALAANEHGMTYSDPVTLPTPAAPGLPPPKPIVTVEQGEGFLVVTVTVPTG